MWIVRAPSDAETKPGATPFEHDLLVLPVIVPVDLFIKSFFSNVKKTSNIKLDV